MPYPGGPGTRREGTASRPLTSATSRRSSTRCWPCTVSCLFPFLYLSQASARCRIRVENTIMVDRKARDAMSGTIQSFMDQRIGAFEFDDTLCEIASTTNDASVRAVQRALWLHYSDVVDHKFVGAKEEWDYFNRLRLLLASDAQTEWCATGKRWNIFKTLSALCLAGFVVTFSVHRGEFFAVYWILSGFVAWSLWLAWHRKCRRAWAPQIPIYPFPSFKRVFSVRRGLPDFTRKPYPKSMSWRAKIRHTMSWITLLLWWLVFAPLGLLILSLPTRESELRLKESAAGV